MKNLFVCFLFLFATIFSAVFAQERDKVLLANGMNFIETRIYSPEDDAKILELYKNLRVADVSDGLDMVGLPGIGLVNPAIHADWVDLKGFTHIFRGIAVTVRYVPTQRPSQPAPGEEFPKWEGNFYNSF